MHKKSDSKVMVGNETDEIIKELFNSPLKRYPKKIKIKETKRFFI